MHSSQRKGTSVPTQCFGRAPSDVAPSTCILHSDVIRGMDSNSSGSTLKNVVLLDGGVDPAPFINWYGSCGMSLLIHEIITLRVSIMKP